MLTVRKFEVFRSLRAKIALGTAVAAVAVAAGTTIVVTLPASAVAGGEDAPEGTYPFAVKFLMTGIPNPDGTTRDSACSGSLVAAQWVLTAGHCFHDVDRVPVRGPVPYRTEAVVGRTDDANTSEGREVAVTEVRQSPLNDIALAKLAEPVTDVRPIQLRTTAPQMGETVTLAGWGQTSADANKPATHLRIGKMTVHSVEDATTTVTGSWPRPDTSACPSDSGAPYFVDGGAEPALVSVENNGPSCPHDQPETTARVDVVAGWVQQQTGTAA